MVINLAQADAGAGPDMGYVPHVVLALYMIVLLGIGVVGLLRSKTSEEDYYLAGRGQGFIVTSLTIMATFFSSAAMLGIPGLVYKDGVAFVLFALNLPIGAVAVYLMGSRIARAGRAKGYVTPADMVADYYGGSTALRLLTALVGFLYVVPYVVMQIQAGGLLAERMFPDAQPIALLGAELDVFDMGATALSIITMLYILVGGMRSVAWSDVLQGLLLLGGMLLAGVATVVAMGGVGAYFEKVSALPVEAQGVPGATGGWPMWKLLTVCTFAAVASMIQPGQWMRYYAAKSTGTLRRSAVIFATVLPLCFLCGVMLVALGGRVLYPPGVDASGALVPHPELSSFDQIVIVMLQVHLPELLGAAGVVLVSVILVAVMAASMSTADSNLHALAAVLTRDVYDKYVRPKAGEVERAWVGRAVIVVATGLALWLVHVGQTNKEFEPIRLIAQLSFVAIAFSCQLLPAVIDMLFVRRGTPAGAIAGIVAGLVFVFGFTPFPAMMLGEGYAAGRVNTLFGDLASLLDKGFCGFVVNAIVFIAVSAFTRKLDPQHVRDFADVMDRAPLPGEVATPADADATS